MSDSNDSNPRDGAEPRSDESGDRQQPLLGDQVSGFISPGRHNILLIYILYLIGVIPMAGIVPIIIGFVMAVLNRDDADPLERSHYEYLVRQGLMGLAFVVISSVLTLVLIGFLGFIAIAIWWIIRSVKGLSAINHHEPIANPKTWTW